MSTGPVVPPWGLILAGGEGSRLKPLTLQVAGDARPKQFCALLGGESLLDRTRRRMDLLVRWDHQLVVVTRKHLRYARYLERDLAPARLVVQPEDRGTAAGIVYPLVHLRELAGNVPVVIFPSDHDVSDDAAFAAHVSQALAVVQERRDVVVILGIEPTHPETEYGWIEPAMTPLPVEADLAFPVRRFWEKPSPALAQTLLAQGALWNSFVMVGWLATILDLVAETVPDLFRAFAALRGRGSRLETKLAERIYARLPSIGFSERVLSRGSGRLAVVRVKGVEWSDWGKPERVLESLRRTGRRPSWLSQVGLASTA